MKSYLKKEKSLVDIFLFGSAIKSKEKPNDIDIILLFRTKDYEKIEHVIYEIKKLEKEIKLHIEPLVVDNMHKEPIYTTLLHEGFSIKHMKFLNDLLGFKSFLLITYSLENKTPSDKVRFSYALYGRKKGEGILKSLNGQEVGRGSILVPINKQGETPDFFKQWNVKYKERRVAIFEK